MSEKEKGDITTTVTSISSTTSSSSDSSSSTSTSSSSSESVSLRPQSGVRSHRSKNNPLLSDNKTEKTKRRAITSLEPQKNTDQNNNTNNNNNNTNSNSNSSNSDTVSSSATSSSSPSLASSSSSSPSLSSTSITAKNEAKDDKDKLDSDLLHKLEHTWTFWFDKPQHQSSHSMIKGGNRSNKGQSLENYQNNLREVGTFDNVEHFWRYFNHMTRASNLDINANYHLFKGGIKPMWEDPQNARGGKWQIRLKKEKKPNLDLYWQNLVLALIGETADEADEICGVVVSRRKQGDRLAIWNRDRNDRERNLALGKRLKKLMLEGTGVQEGDDDFSMEYLFHEDSQKTGSSHSAETKYSL